MGLRNELVGVRRGADEEGLRARVATEQLARNGDLLDRARELLAELAHRDF